MSRRAIWSTLAATAFLSSLASPAYAYIRLRPCGTTLNWPSGAWPLAYTICNKDTDGSDVSTAEKTAVRLAFGAWDGLAGTGVAFSENTSLASKAFSNLSETSSHLIVFDTAQSYSWPSSGTIAVTLITYALDSGSCPTTGAILDGDIVVNSGSSAFSIATGAEGQSGLIDLQNVLTHEIGHFIGLDHVPVPSSTMTALASLAEISKRSLTQDDVSGAAEIRPSGSGYGTISGTINRPGGLPAAYPYVVALDSNGGVASGALGASTGTFSLSCPAGSGITVYATPYPTTVGSEISDSGTRSTDFSMSFYGDNDTPTTYTVTGGGSQSIGTLTTNDVIGAGTIFDYPLDGVPSDWTQVVRGSNAAVSLAKSAGSFAGLSLELSNPSSPDLTATGTSVTANVVSFTANAASNAVLGARDVRLANGGSPNKKIVSIGAIEILDAAPTASGMDVTSGSGDGGTSVVISGTGFSGTTSTLKVLFGDTLGTVTNVASTAVTVSSPAHAAGAVTVGLINADGQGVNVATQFTFNVSLASVSPASVCHSKQQTITLTGGGFEDGMTVAVNGTDCTNVVVASGSSATAKLPKLDPGTYTILITKLDASTASLVDGIVFSTSCGGGGGGCFGSVNPQPMSPADHLGLLLPFAVLFFVLHRISRRREVNS